ncbi:uncharacterized protein LOC125034615 [Penaeus chinensis]|uniref:uncharacterized protein LOC125034615 n=1 Tax=Penaeus chinensis TaxID=139456 RepID=UPI001FB6866C|nr:uncharacterized protein LOC125034615 [Penaeus chinensis]
MLQPSPSQTVNVPPSPIIINHTEIKTVEKFCYLGSTVTNSGSLDTGDAKASADFGRLSELLWQDHGRRLSTKIAVYRVVVLSALLYRSETWTMYLWHIQQLEQFHQRCLRKICNINLQVL